MLRSVIISPDSEFADELEDFFHESGQIGVLRKVAHYPNAVDLIRLIRSHAPQVIFLGVESSSKAAEVVAEVEKNLPGIQFVAVHRTCDPSLLLEAMRLGMREFLSLPFCRQTYYDMVARLEAALEKRPPAIASTDLVFSFLPAKAGVGASTIALNASAAVAKLTKSNALLCDLDLNSGMVRFMLKLENQHSIQDAAEHSSDIDETLWPQLVTSLGDLDVLHAGKLNPNIRIEGLQLRHLLEFARRNYQAICLDLSGNLEKYSIEVMHESKRVYLVCTPEIPSLHLAREKFQYLQSLDLGDKVGLLLNRTQKRSQISPEQIENLLGLPIEMTFPNEYHVVQKALHDGDLVNSSTELGKRFSQLAQLMMGNKAVPVVEPKRTFSEILSIVPGRFSLFPDSKKTAS